MSALSFVCSLLPLLGLDAPLVHACSPSNTPQFYVSNFSEGTPDANGHVQGRPNANHLRVAEPMLLSACSEMLCGYEVTIKLEDASTLDHAVTLEFLPHSEFHRIVPGQPLSAGMYTLTLTGKRREQTLVRTYVFQVEDAPEPNVPDLVPVVSKGWGAVSAGQGFTCLESRSAACLGPGVSTQSRPYVVVSAGFEQPVSPEQMNAFLVRIMPVADPGPNALPAWVRTGYPLKLEFREPVPEYCGVVQTLRLRDGAVVTHPPTCFKVEPEALVPYPAAFETCRMADRNAYTRAWCADNRTACRKSNAASAAAPAYCEQYAALCGVHLGRRADDEHVCGP